MIQFDNKKSLLTSIRNGVIKYRIDDDDRDGNKLPIEYYIREAISEYLSYKFIECARELSFEEHKAAITLWECINKEN